MLMPGAHVLIRCTCVAVCYNVGAHVLISTCVDACYNVGAHVLIRWHLLIRCTCVDVRCTCVN